MASLSLIAVPVLLDTVPSTSAPLLLRAWARMYHYGHLALPAMAIGTLGLWLHTAATATGAKQRRTAALVAGVVTVLMVPFTWVFMIGTNNELFRLEAAAAAAAARSERVMEIGDGAGVRALVALWARWHLARSVFPLAGAVVGAVAVVRLWG